MAEFRPTGFNILPIVIKNLLIINGLVFFAQFTFERMGSPWLQNTFALHDIRSVYFKPHQLITHMFMHGDIGHIFFNMFAVWMFGSTLENKWGAKRFLIFYMVTGLGAAALHLFTLYLENNEAWHIYHLLSPEQQLEVLYSPGFSIGDKSYSLNGATMGASGAVFGLLAAFGYLFPNSLIYLYFFIPIKAKWFVLMYAAAELYLGIQNSAGDAVAHWAHLGGALVGFLLVLSWNRNNRRNFY